MLLNAEELLNALDGRLLRSTGSQPASSIWTNRKKSAIATQHVQ